MNTPEGAPERIDMPVIDKKYIRLAIGLLQQGHVDVNPPYGHNIDGDEQQQQPAAAEQGTLNEQ